MNPRSVDKIEDHEDFTVLQPIGADHIDKFIKSKNISLTPKEITALQKTFNKSHYLETLTDLVQHLNTAFNTMNQLSGLSNAEVNELREIRFQLNHYKSEKDKNNLSFSAIKNVVTFETRMIVLDKKRQWWALNIASLDKENIWDCILQLLLKELNTHHASYRVSSEKENAFYEIKKQWDESKIFAGFSSENLLLFYNQFILVLEENLKKNKSCHKKYPEVIQQALNELENNIQILKQQAHDAIQYRLNAAQYYEDPYCDDIIHYTAHQLLDITGVTILHFDQAPPKRRSLNPELKTAFANIVKHASLIPLLAPFYAFIKNNKKFNYPLIEKYYSALLNITSDEFKLTLLKDYQNKLIQHPYLLTLINHLGETSVEVKIKNSVEIEFFPLLSFSKEFHELKNTFKMVLQVELLKEAGYSQTSIRQVTPILALLPSLSDIELLALSKVITKKLKNAQTNPSTHLGLTHYLFKLSDITEKEVSKRVEKNTSLLKKSSSHYQPTLWQNDREFHSTLVQKAKKLFALK